MTTPDVLMHEIPDSLECRMDQLAYYKEALAYLRIIAYWSMPRSRRRRVEEPEWPDSEQ